VDLNTVLSRAAQKFAERTFIRFAGADLTFAEFNAAVVKPAGGFRELGVGEGDRVVVMMRNSIEMVHIWFATNILGAVFVPINFELKSITLEQVVKAVAGKMKSSTIPLKAPWFSKTSPSLSKVPRSQESIKRHRPLNP
jgi:crotonobetaine/carnitine-CoA ligase